MKKLAPAWLSILFLSAFFSANAEPSSPPLEGKETYPNSLIRQVYVQGLRRTHPSVVEPYIAPLRGKPFTPERVERLVQDLRSLGIFHSIRANPQPDGNGGVDVQVTLEEKWTLIPIPLGGASSGGNVYGGLLVFESNLFGLNKKFYGGGMLSESSWRGMFGYIDPRLFQSKNALFLGFSGGVDQVQHVTRTGGLIRRYEKTGFDLISEIALPLGKGFAFGVGAQFHEQDISPSYERSYNPPDSGRYASPTVSVRYQNLWYGPVLVFGISGNLRYEQGFDFKEGESYGRFSLLSQGFFPIDETHRIGYLAQAQWLAGGQPVLYRKVTGRFLKTIPEGIYADSFWSSQVLVEGVPFQFSWGAPTVLLSYEVGGYRQEAIGGEPSTFIFCHGPGAGFRIYLSRIALPAFGLDVTYSFLTQKVYLFVNAGLQM